MTTQSNRSVAVAAGPPTGVAVEHPRRNSTAGRVIVVERREESL